MLGLERGWSHLVGTGRSCKALKFHRPTARRSRAAIDQRRSIVRGPTGCPAVYAVDFQPGSDAIKKARAISPSWGNRRFGLLIFRSYVILRLGEIVPIEKVDSFLGSFFTRSGPLPAPVLANFRVIGRVRISPRCPAVYRLATRAVCDR